MSVGDRIMQLRKDNNMTQAELAEAVAVSRQAVSKWETGQSLPDTAKLILLAEILSTDIEYLSTGRVNDAIRPPIVLHSVEKIETKIEVPVVQVEERIIEKPVIEYIEKPVNKTIIKYHYRRNWLEYVLIAIVCYFLGLISANFF